jgi:hypothetical protein
MSHFFPNDHRIDQADVVTTFVQVLFLVVSGMVALAMGLFFIWGVLQYLDDPDLIMSLFR